MVTWAGRPSRGFCGACATVFRGSSPRLGLPSPPGFLRGSFSSESEVETEAQRGGENRPDPSVGVAAELEPRACGRHRGRLPGKQAFLPPRLCLLHHAAPGVIPFGSSLELKVEEPVKGFTYLRSPPHGTNEKWKVVSKCEVSHTVGRDHRISCKRYADGFHGASAYRGPAVDELKVAPASSSQVW